jgi:hypothetical protein
MKRFLGRAALLARFAARLTPLAASLACGGLLIRRRIAQAVCLLGFYGDKAKP